MPPRACSIRRRKHRRERRTGKLAQNAKTERRRDECATNSIEQPCAEFFPARLGALGIEFARGRQRGGDRRRGPRSVRACCRVKLVSRDPRRRADPLRRAGLRAQKAPGSMTRKAECGKGGANMKNGS